MDPQWRERGLYPALGIVSLLSLLYLNFRGHIQLPVLWLPAMSFVGTNSTGFFLVDDSAPSPTRRVYVNGWNSYWMLEESSWGESRSKVSEMMKRGAEMGLTVCRTWAFNDGNRPNSLQISPGVFNERVFQGLDYIIVEARRHGIRLILSLVNNLNAFGGKAQYVRWAQEAGFDVSSSNDTFFSHPVIKNYYKSYAKAILTRKNSISGVSYSEEPAIFAWELINEPRCESSSSTPILEAWIKEMAAFVKHLDSKHMVTVGLEGFYGLERASKVNPGEWAALLGSDFITDSAMDDIDFASVHAYPHSWIPVADFEAKIDYLLRWINSHIKDGEEVLKKPVLITEVGSPLGTTTKQGSHDRDAVFQTVYDRIYDSAKKNEAGAGSLIWQLLVEGLEGYSDRFSFVAQEHPSTYKLIVEQSCRLENISSRGQAKRKLRGTDRCFGKVS